MLAYEDKLLTTFNTYTHPTDPPITHLRGQYPMTASEPPAKWVPTAVVMIIWCAEWRRAGPPQPAGGEEGTRERRNVTAKWQIGAARQVPEQQTEERETDKNSGTLVCPPWANATCAQQKRRSAEDKVGRCEHSKHASNAEDKVGRHHQP